MTRQRAKVVKVAADAHITDGMTFDEIMARGERIQQEQDAAECQRRGDVSGRAPICLRCNMGPCPHWVSTIVPRLKDHEFAQLVNELRDTAVEFGRTQQLRERLVGVLIKYLPRK